MATYINGTDLSTGGSYRLVAWKGKIKYLKLGMVYELFCLSFMGDLSFKDDSGINRSAILGTWEVVSTEEAPEPIPVGRGEMLLLTGTKEDAWLDVIEGKGYIVTFDKEMQGFVFFDELNNKQCANMYTWDFTEG